MVSGGSLIGFALLVLATAAGLRLYLPAAHAVLVRGAGRVDDGWVRFPDAAVAAVLAAWLGVQAHAALLHEGERILEFRHIATGAAVYASVVLFLVGVLVYRDLSPLRVFGIGQVGFGSVLGRGVLYIAACYPLLVLVQAMVHGASGGDLAPQDVVRFLQDAETPRDRFAVVVMAAAVAPIAEEVIFRGYLYAVAKKYLGSFVALAGTAVLFALLHGHAASVPALFTLAVCLGLAYEMTGSLLVPMIMHAVFNAFQLVVILFLL